MPLVFLAVAAVACGGGDPGSVEGDEVTGTTSEQAGGQSDSGAEGSGNYARVSVAG